jgi:hypothetical protein
VLKNSLVGFHGGVSDRAISNGLNQIETMRDQSGSDRASMKREWSAKLQIALAQQDAMLGALGRPTWYLAQFDVGDLHYLARQTGCDGDLTTAMIIASPKTLRAIALPTHYEGVRSLGSARARLRLLGVGHPICYMR